MRPMESRQGFVTESGEQVPAIAAEKTVDVDRVAVQETVPNLYQMMESAGRNLAILAMRLLGSQWPSATDLARLAEVTAQQLRVFRSTAGRVGDPDDRNGRPDLIIDALSRQAGSPVRGSTTGRRLRARLSCASNRLPATSC